MTQFIIKRRFNTLQGEQLVTINGKKQKIRYAPGEDSIFVKEQSEHAKAKLIQVSNQMINTDDALLEEFLKAWSQSANWIEEYNPNKYAKAQNEKSEMKAKAYTYITTKDAGETGVVGYILGGRGLVYKPNGEAKSIDLIKQALYPIAETKAEEIVKAYDQVDEKKMEFIVGKAFIDNILSYSPSSNKVVFTQSGQTVLQLSPNSGTDVEQVSDWFKTKEGKKDLDDVKNYLSMQKTGNDFTEIDGIGASTAKKFREIGIKTFADVKNLSLEEFETKLQEGGVKIVGNTVEYIYNEIVG